MTDGALEENVHYQLVPIEEGKNSQAWAVRFLEGPHPETVIRYGNIALDPKDDCLRFNFEIESTPDNTLTVEDLTVQEYAADVLESVLAQAAIDGSLATKES